VVVLVLVETSAPREALAVQAEVALVDQVAEVQAGQEDQVLEGKVTTEELAQMVQQVLQHVEVVARAEEQVVLETLGQAMVLSLYLQEELVLHLTFLVLA
jgi:hypothetical protein